MNATQQAVTAALDHLIGQLMTDYNAADDGTLTVFFGHDRRLVIDPQPTMNVRVEIDKEG